MGCLCLHEPEGTRLRGRGNTHTPPLAPCPTRQTDRAEPAAREERPAGSHQPGCAPHGRTPHTHTGRAPPAPRRPVVHGRFVCCRSKDENFAIGRLVSQLCHRGRREPQQSSQGPRDSPLSGDGHPSAHPGNRLCPQVPKGLGRKGPQKALRARTPRRAGRGGRPPGAWRMAGLWDDRDAAGQRHLEPDRKQAAGRAGRAQTPPPAPGAEAGRAARRRGWEGPLRPPLLCAQPEQAPGSGPPEGGPGGPARQLTRTCPESEAALATDVVKTLSAEAPTLATVTVVTSATQGPDSARRQNRPPRSRWACPRLGHTHAERNPHSPTWRRPHLPGDRQAAGLRDSLSLW